MKRMKSLLGVILVFALVLNSLTVIATAPKVNLSNVKVVQLNEGESIKLVFTCNTIIKATVKIYDGKNKVKKILIDNKSLKKGTRSVNWNLLDNKGKRVAVGRYKAVLNARNSRNNIIKIVYFKVYKDKKVNLNDISRVDNLGVDIWEKPKDSQGNLYQNGLLYSLDAEEEIIVNLLYKEFVGQVVLPYDDRSLRNGAKLQIFLDDKLEFDTQWMLKGSYPVGFKINLSGIKKIRIVYLCNLVGFSDKPPRLGLVDGYLIKK